MKVLVICDGNVNRSPTVADFLRTHYPEWEVRDAGIYYGYPYQVNQELVDWAEKIFVMEKHQYTVIYYKYGKKSIVLNIPDEYERFSNELYRECEKIFKK